MAKKLGLNITKQYKNMNSDLLSYKFQKDLQEICLWHDGLR